MGMALKRAELSLLLTSDSGIRALNKKWRGKNKATDVLSFPLHSMQAIPDGSWELGDLVISLDRAKAQAKEHGVTLRQELDLLLVHGLLHLIGFDHEISSQEAQRMRLWEQKLLGRAGLIG